MFSNDDIIRMAGGVTYERGRQLYDAGYVLDMDVQTAGDYDEIVASVRGSGAKVYETDLLILRETGELEECYCECPAFRSYDGICKHCVAVWLQYRAEEGYEEVSQPIRRRNPVAALTQFSGTLVSIFPSFLLLSGLLLLSFIPELGFWSIGFFLGSLLASMGGRLYLSSRLKRFDDHYLDGVDDGDASLRKERYAHYHAYKAAVFSTAPQLLSSLFELMAAFSFLAFADLQLGLSIAILILLLCLKHLLTRPSLDKKHRRIERLEKAFLSEAPTDRKAILRSLGEESESFSFAFLIDHAFGSFLALCLACLSLLPSSFSAERFLFVGMSLLFVSSLVEKCFDSAKKLREKKAEEGYFRLHFMN